MDYQSIIERIKYIMKVSRLSAKSLCNNLNISSSALYNYFNGSRDIPLNIIIYILKTYPQISTDWLLFGEGEMEVDRISIERLNAIIEEKNAKIEALQHQVRQLEKRIDTILNNLK